MARRYGRKAFTRETDLEMLKRWLRDAIRFKREAQSKEMRELDYICGNKHLTSIRISFWISRVDYLKKRVFEEMDRLGRL